MRIKLLIMSIVVSAVLGCGGSTEVTIPENPDPPVGADALQPIGDDGGGDGATVTPEE